MPAAFDGALVAAFSLATAFAGLTLAGTVFSRVALAACTLVAAALPAGAFAIGAFAAITLVDVALADTFAGADLAEADFAVALEDDVAWMAGGFLATSAFAGARSSLVAAGFLEAVFFSPSVTGFACFLVPGTVAVTAFRFVDDAFDFVCCLVAIGRNLHFPDGGCQRLTRP